MNSDTGLDTGPRPGGATRTRRGASSAPSLGNDLVATAALCTFSIVVGIGYARVFSGWTFLDEMVVIAVVGHGVGFVLRRLRTPGLLAVPAMVVVLGWPIGLLYAADTYRF